MSGYYRNSESYYDPTAGAALTRIEREEKKKQYRPLVYIVSRYAGDIKANVAAAQNYCRFAVDNGYIPLASHLFYPQFMDDATPEGRELGLFFGKILMDKCDEVWIFGSEISSGMQAEFERARRKHYIIRRFSSDCAEIGGADGSI